MSSISAEVSSIPAKRADARKNIAAILDAATACLAVDADADINDVAQVLDRAMAASDAELEAVDLSGDTREALGRLLEASWHVTHRYGGLVPAAQAMAPETALREAHEKPKQRMLTLLRRGRRAGTVRGDVPLEWQVLTIQGLLHAASAAVHRGELAASRAPGLVQMTLLSALAPAGPVSPPGGVSRGSAS